MAAVLVILAGFTGMAQAGKITSAPSASGAAGFGGWNLDNVTVMVPGGSFNEATGAYTIGPDGLYWSDVDDGAGTVMATVSAREWPVGEPPGIKIINDDALVLPPGPENCIMATTYLAPDLLDTLNPVQVVCSSPTRSNREFMVAMLPSLVDGAGAESVDLVFNVEAEAGVRDYQMFQKINNWTDSRLEGFTLHVGFGVGAGFQTVTQAGVPLAHLSLSVPGALWAPDELASFSQGLFGPMDINFPEDGFFDDVRAGFQIDEYPVLPGVVDTLTASTTLEPFNGSNYADVPAGAGAADNQFGPWLPNIWLPRGIFDDDNDPDTDDPLVAWFGFNPATPGYEWMYGGNGVVNPVAFGTVSAQDFAAWTASPDHYVDEIDDLANIGLNYLVTIGDITTFPVAANNTFTIRITPTADTSGSGAPGFVVNLPPGTGELVVTDSINIGDSISIRVTDSDLNTNNAAVDAAMVPVVNIDSAEQVMVTLTETGPATGVFTGVMTTFDRTRFLVNPPVQDMGVAGGDTLTTTYIDAEDALDNMVTLTADTHVIDLVIAAGGGGGGGGCAMVGDKGLDPTLPLLVMFALVYLGIRRRGILL
jgi:hypothetical protein